MQNNDKQILASTMRRLITSINNNKQQQLKIFESLSRDDIFKILHNFDHSQQAVRKMSARLITELTLDNTTIKEKLGQILGVYPRGGNIVLNKIPEGVRAEIVVEIMRAIGKANVQGKNETGGGKIMCWYVNPFKKEIAVEVVSTTSFDAGDFLDPSIFVFGIIGSQEKQVLDLPIPTLMFNKEGTSSNTISVKPILMSQTKVIKPQQPINTSVQKVRFTFSSRERGNTMTEQSTNIPPTVKIGELCFRGDKRLNHNFGAATDRNKVEDKSLSPSQNIQLTSSMHFRTKDSPELKTFAGIGKFRKETDLTSPTSVNSNPIRFRFDRNDKSQQKKQLSFATTNKPKDLSNSNNSSNLNGFHKPLITFSAKSPHTPSSYRAPNSSTPSNNNPHKIDYMKIISQFKTGSSIEPETKMYGDYKYGDDFLQKIKGSIKTRE